MDQVKDKKILLVEDEPELLQMLETILKKDGFHQVFGASTALEALSLTAKCRPDAAVLDVMLPDGDGFSLLGEIKKIRDIPVLFLTAIINLISNSAKHNREGCNISIAVRPSEDKYACLIISDTGTGISKDIIERLNEQDYLSAWTKQSHGLGLIIAKSIVEVHQGQLILESAGGKGTRITIRLPVQQ